MTDPRTPTEPSTPDRGTVPPTRRSATFWARVALVIALLLISGGVRLRQVRRVEAALTQGRESPFPLSTVPLALGSWVGTPTDLDPRIVEATGSTDHVTRRYVDRRTGVTIDVILLYGPTSDIFIHSPELCYPKAGFAWAGETIERPIEDGRGRVPFRSVAFVKGDPAGEDRQEVYYSWRYNGRWSTSVSSPKESERIPGMYKVQVARRISSKESRTLDNPCEDFLGALLPDLESRIVRQTAPDPKA